MPRKNDQKKSKSRACFKLQAPEAQQVVLCGTFNDWDQDTRRLKRSKNGIWSTFLSLEPGTYEYRFLVDGQWQNDPNADVVPNPFGSQNNVLMV